MKEQNEVLTKEALFAWIGVFEKESNDIYPCLQTVAKQKG